MARIASSRVVHGLPPIAALFACPFHSRPLPSWFGAARRSHAIFVMSTQSTPPQRVVILAAVDGSALSPYVVAAGAKFAAMPGAELHLVHVIDAVADSKRLTEQLERGRQILEDLGLDVERAAIPLTLHL